MNRSKSFLSQAHTSVLTSVAVYLLALLLGAGESRTGAQRGIEPHFAIAATAAVGVYCLVWVRKNWGRLGTRELAEKVVLVGLFLTVGALMVPFATGTHDLTYDYDYPQYGGVLEGALVVSGSFVLGFMLAALVGGMVSVIRRIRRKPGCSLA